MSIRSKALKLVILAVVVGGLSVACGSEGSESSDDSQGGSDQRSEASTQENSRPSAEVTSNAADTLGNLLLLSSDDNLGTSCTLTFADPETGQSSSRTFSLPEGAALNPGGQSSVLSKRCGSWRLPFNEDFTKLAIVFDPQEDYYRSAGYVAADADYTEKTTSQSSFEGESGYYAATFHDAQFWVMNRNHEWKNPASGEVRDGPPTDDNTGNVDLYISGSGLKDYGLGHCSVPSQDTGGCYKEDPYVGKDLSSSGSIEFFGNKAAIGAFSDKTIRVEGGSCDLLLAVDSKGSFYCAEELSNGQQRLIRIDVSTRVGITTGKAHAITPKTDQEILQAIVSSNGKQVLFTARRESDPVAAYAVAAADKTEPRKLSALTGQLSEDQKLYRWTARKNYTSSDELTTVKETESQSEQVWSGQITAGNEDDSTSEYSIEANIVPIPEMTDELVGEAVGTVSYDSLNCSGLWFLKEVNESSVVMEEQIRDRPAGTCVDTGPVTLTPKEADTLKYRRVDENNSDNVDVGTLTLQANTTPETTSAETTEPTTNPETTTLSEIQNPRTTSSADNGGDPDTEGDTDSSQDREKASLSQAVGDYYLAAGAEEWAYTYDHLASQTKSMFTKEEWSRKNQWFWDRNPVVYHILSTNVDGSSGEPTAEVEVRITGEDGSSRNRTTYFVQEDGEWKHRFSEVEKDLFMPDATFEEVVEAREGANTPE